MPRVGADIQFYSFFNLDGILNVSCQRQVPTFLTLGKTRYPFYGRLGGLQVCSGRVRKVSPPSGFGLRTVQPVMSRYTNYSVLAHTYDFII